jgi:hydrogenase maturation protease
VTGGDVLVAGAGNVFRNDDGFGVAVVERLLRDPPRPGVIVRDYGIRGLHLAYDLLAPLRLLIIVDAVERGEPPGTLFVIAPEPGREVPPALTDAHGMDLPAVFARVAALGGTLPRVLIVGCQPAELAETIGLTPQVEQAVEPAAELVRTVLSREGAAPPPPGG